MIRGLLIQTLLIGNIVTTVSSHLAQFLCFPFAVNQTYYKKQKDISKTWITGS